MMTKWLKRKNYLTMIENSARGDNYLFRNRYYEADGKEIDDLEDGMLGCAMVVSSILVLNELISEVNVWVSETEELMLKASWYEINEPRDGAVLIWEAKLGSDGKMHRHIGFYVGNDMAVSNDSKQTGFPHKHHYTYNGTRRIEKIMWHPMLDEK